MKNIAIVSLSLLGLGAAQSTTASADSAVKTHAFSVGADGRTFTPHFRTVPVGDILEFRFYPQNHSVVKAEFSSEPCIPYEMTGSNKIGFWSGWKPTKVVDTSNQPIFRIKVNDTEPLAVYCSSPDACKEGMVAVINGNATHNYEAQLKNTQGATAFLSPGEYWPEEKLDPTSTGAAGASATGDKNGTTPYPHSLSTGAIAGIAVGGFVVLCLAGGIFYMCGRHKSFKEMLKRPSSKNGTSTTNPSIDASTAYHPASPGLSEANYPNMKSPAMSDARFSAQTYGGDTYRGGSPAPTDDRGHSMYGVMNSGGQMSPGMPSPNWPSPAPHYQEMHEADSSSIAKSPGQAPVPYLVHEMQGSELPPQPSPHTPASTPSYAHNKR